jgi:restriction system protein
MITTQIITLRAAFVGTRLLDHLRSDPTASGEFADGGLLIAYRQCMGQAWDEKLNLYGFKKLLAELGVETPLVAKELVERCRLLEPTKLISKLEIEAAYNSFVESNPNSAAPATAASRLYLAGRAPRNAADGLFSEVVANLADSIQRSYELAVLRSAESIIREHVKTLGRKRTQLLLQDDYGAFDESRWRGEIGYFLQKVLLPRLERPVADGTMKAIADLVDHIASEATVDIDSSVSNVPARISPAEFECHCADVLREHGWQTRLTKSSGDQGVDIVAERGGIKMVVQCKQYSNVVGNGAVQEIHAGKGFMGADIAVVVSNTSFTRSAGELAASLDVHLVHDSELPELDKVLFNRAWRPIGALHRNHKESSNAGN